MNRRLQKGIRVSKLSRSARSPFLRTVVQAQRGVFGGGGGSGAPALRLIGLTAVVAAAFLALGVSLASAKETHVFKSSFGEAGSGPGQLALAANSGLAIDQTTHDVYVADTGNNHAHRLDLIGAPA
jgi:hypothetical protein